MEDERKAIVKLLESSYFKTLINSPVDKIYKYNVQADLLRTTGNDYYKKKVHNSRLHNAMLQFYSRSIGRAENDSESLAMSYGNRSAALLHLSKYNESISDIDRALKVTKNDNLKLKLLLRKVKCLHFIGSKDDRKIFNKAELLVNQMNCNKSLGNSFQFQAELDKVKDLLKKSVVQNNPAKDNNAEAMKTLNKKHKLNDFSSVEIQCNKKYGRHLVAAKNFKPGDVIYIEKPYVQYINPMKQHASCTHCFVTVWDNIPCDHCAYVLFCSEQCKNEAWEMYHEIECAVYADFKLDTNDSNKQLALRILSRALKEYESIENLKAEVSTIEKSTDYKEGFMHNGKIQANGFKSIYCLCKNVSADTMDNHKTDAALLLRSFARNTSFFGKDFDPKNVESYNKNEDAIFLGSLILRLIKISQLNTFQMWNRSYKCQYRFRESECLERECCTAGFYIAPITSLLNHDCFPNTGRCYTNEHTVIFYALGPIKKGDQIFTSYLKIFTEDNVPYRQKSLTQMYNFECDCFSCQQNMESGFKRTNMDVPLATDFVNQPLDTIDLQLSLEFGELMCSAKAGNFEKFDCDEKTISRLKKGLLKAFSSSRSRKSPSVVSCGLVGFLQMVFDVIYGFKLELPEDCNYV